VPELPDLEATLGDTLVEVQTTEVADDWHRRWTEFHKPTVIGDAVAIRAPWHTPVDSVSREIVIDPARAFGTGSHATTKLCLELMLELDGTGPLVDLGCGSGVLAIAAAQMGYKPVTALDNDQLAVEAAAENAEINSVKIEVQHFDLRTDALPQAPTVVANLLKPLLLELAASCSYAPKKMILSGLLVGEGESVADAFQSLGLSLRKTLYSGDWEALLLER